MLHMILRKVADECGYREPDENVRPSGASNNSGARLPDEDGYEY